MIIFVYAALVFLVLRFSVTLFNFLSNPKLGHYGKHFNEKVSIVICSSTGDVSDAEQSIRKQDYQNIEVLIQDPGETLNNLVNRSTGKYLLFLYNEVSIGRGLINNLIYRTKVYNLGLLSIVPNWRMKSFYDLCYYPLFDFVQMNILPFRLVMLSGHPAFSVSNQACMFFNAEIYKTHLNGGPGSAKMGAEVMKQLKQMKFKAEVLQANKFVYLEERYGQLATGKWLLRIFGDNIYAALIYLVLLIAGPVIMACNFEPDFLVLPVGLIFLTRIMISFLTHQNPVVNVLMHPLQVLILVTSILRAIFDRLLTQVRYRN